MSYLYIFINFLLKSSYLFFIFFIIPFCEAQSAYNQWLSVQGQEVHLRGDDGIKTIYESSTGEKKDLKLSQQQFFENGRMIRDIMYINFPSELMYDISIDYSKDTLALGVNRLDSSLVTYAFTKDNKILYYVVEQQSDLHVIYTYDEQGLLLRSKDCLLPFGEHRWCAYYSYYYNDNKTLHKALSYNLEQGKPVESKTLFAYDSLVYENGLLKSRLTMNPFGLITNQVNYQYNKQNLLEIETSKQVESQFLEVKSYTKKYSYYCNNKLKLQVENYFSNEKFLGKQSIYYDKKGRKVKQESFKDKKRSKLYQINYE